MGARHQSLLGPHPEDRGPRRFPRHLQGRGALHHEDQTGGLLEGDPGSEARPTSLPRGRHPTNRRVDEAPIRYVVVTWTTFPRPSTTRLCWSLAARALSAQTW